MQCRIDVFIACLFLATRHLGTVTRDPAERSRPNRPASLKSGPLLALPIIGDAFAQDHSNNDQHLE